jgi:hypothetical protein
MELIGLENVVDAIAGRKRLGKLGPFELLESIRRKSFPAATLPIIEPLLHMENPTYKYAIEMVGKMKGASADASDAVDAAWERSWQNGVPQACKEAFRALLRIGGNDERLLRMINKTMEIDNYGIHKECAETLMKIRGGKAFLANWSETIPGKCHCDLHKKLSAKIAEHLATA